MRLPRSRSWRGPAWSGCGRRAGHRWRSRSTAPPAPWRWCWPRRSCSPRTRGPAAVLPRSRRRGWPSPRRTRRPRAGTGGAGSRGKPIGAGHGDRLRPGQRRDNPAMCPGHRAQHRCRHDNSPRTHRPARRGHHHPSECAPSRRTGRHRVPDPGSPRRLHRQPQPDAAHRRRVQPPVPPGDRPGAVPVRHLARCADPARCAPVGPAAGPRRALPTATSRSSALARCARWQRREVAHRSSWA